MSDILYYGSAIVAGFFGAGYFLASLLLSGYGSRSAGSEASMSEVAHQGVLILVVVSIVLLWLTWYLLA